MIVSPLQGLFSPESLIPNKIEQTAPGKGRWSVVREVRVPPELRDQLDPRQNVYDEDVWDDEGIEADAEGRLDPDRPAERPAPDASRCDPRRPR
jgi:hypothetical protein